MQTLNQVTLGRLGQHQTAGHRGELTEGEEGVREAKGRATKKT